jgi:hypothetical protein
MQLEDRSRRPLQTTIFFELKTAELRSIGMCSLLFLRRIDGKIPRAPSENYMGKSIASE